MEVEVAEQLRSDEGQGLNEIASDCHGACVVWHPVPVHDVRIRGWDDFFESERDLEMNSMRSQLEGVVRDALLHCWDPIGIGKVPGASDEYDVYLPKLIEMLLDGDDQKAISTHLSKIESSSLGLPSHLARCEQAARSLLIVYHRCLLCPALNVIVDAEIARGNSILDTSCGGPRGNDVVVRLENPVTATTPIGMDRRNAAETSEWHEEIYDHRSGSFIAW